MTDNPTAPKGASVLSRKWSYTDRQTGLTGDDVLPDGRLAYTTETGDGLVPCDCDCDPCVNEREQEQVKVVRARLHAALAKLPAPNLATPTEREQT